MQPYIPARFLRRYKRFFSDCRLEDGEVIVAQCANTGSMKTLLEPERIAYLRSSDDPKRKLRYSLVLLEVEEDRFALIDTAMPNAIVAVAVTEGRVEELAGYTVLKREPRLESKRRMDLLLEDHPDGRPKAYIEIENVTMLSDRAPRRADFPDAVTTRGAQHLLELEQLKRAGYRACQFFLLGRNDCDHVGIAESIDPGYAAALRRARDAGVEILAHGLEIVPEEGRVQLGKKVPVVFD